MVATTWSVVCHFQPRIHRSWAGNATRCNMCRWKARVFFLHIKCNKHLKRSSTRSLERSLVGFVVCRRLKTIVTVHAQEVFAPCWLWILEQCRVPAPWIQMSSGLWFRNWHPWHDSRKSCYAARPDGVLEHELALFSDDWQVVHSHRREFLCVSSCDIQEAWHVSTCCRYNTWYNQNRSK